MVPDGPASPYHVVERLNTHIDRLIPYYTIAGSSSAGLNSAPTVGIYRGNEAGGTAFELKDEKEYSISSEP
jgi:hypothetical protein